MLPDPLVAIAQIPNALRATIKDAQGVEHSCAVTGGVSETKHAAEYGIPMFSGDTVYVAAPFIPPAGFAVIKTADGKTSRRRINSYTTYGGCFVVLQVGESA